MLKKLFAISIFLVVLISIPIGMYLVRQSQIVRSRASENPVVSSTPAPLTDIQPIDAGEAEIKPPVFSTEPFSAECVGCDIPTTLKAGQPQTYQITVKNSGPNSWERVGRAAVTLVVTLTPEPPNQSQQPITQRYYLTRSINSDESATFQVSLSVPVLVGPYLLVHSIEAEYLNQSKEIGRSVITVK